MEISKTGTRREERGRIKKKTGSGRVESKEKTFQAELKQVVSVDLEGSLEEILGELQDQEKRFMDQQTPWEMNRYKAMVQKILKMILDDSIVVHTIKRRRRDNRADWTVAEVINGKLLEISEALTRGNTAFNTMKTMEEIRGLLLDLMH